LGGWPWRRFALHFVPTELLAREIAGAGFVQVRVQKMGPWTAFAEARRGTGQV
jgi:hypothetical protein